uniref:BatD family protein n=1 Tax=Flavobacterium sp. TaxID=239 RepID=UPI00404A30D6
MKKIVFLVILCMQTVAFAQVKFEAKVNKQTVGQNEKFQISFSINEDADNFKEPNFDGFIVVGGPFQSTNFSWINGVKSFNRSYSYILEPTKKGTFTIAAASIEHGDEILKTQPLKIVVTEAIPIPKDPNSPDYVAGEGVHLVAEVSKANPFVSEPVTVVYKLYFDPRFVVRNVKELKTPKYNGFWSQHIDIQKLEAVQATYKGQDYAMVVWRKVILYPLEAGNKPIEPLSINLEIQVPTGRRTYPFGQQSYQTTTKTVTAGSQTITVKPLPTQGKPENFTGAVGSFSFTAKPNKTSLKTGEALDLEIVVSGNGNLKLFDLPKPKFPSVFEAFDPQHKEEVNTPLSGMNGKIADTYTLVPQFKGKYTLQPLQFSYFDLKTNTYKTLSSKEITIDVLDNPNFTTTQNTAITNKQEVAKNNVFQFIQTNTNFKGINEQDFFGSNLFYALLFAPLLLIPVIILVKKKKEAIDADVFGNKVKRNTRLAKKFLSEAKKQIGNKVPFYMAMEKALHNFLKAKLYIETSEMSKENIQEILHEKQANTKDVEQFLQLMNDCEFARYTPSSDVAMQKDYEKAVEIISELSKQI